MIDHPIDERYEVAAMTDQGAILKLARAVYPNEKWILTDGEVITSCAWVSFDPATKDTQAVAVLCWLMSPALTLADTQKKFFNITSWNIQRMRFDKEFDEPVVCWSVRIESSDPASFRAAVTKAALRVVQG